MKKFTTLIRRELWQNTNGFLMLPFITTVLLVVLLTVVYLSVNPAAIKNEQASPPNFDQQINVLQDGVVAQDAMDAFIMSQLSTGDSIKGTIYTIEIILTVISTIVLLNYIHSALFDDRKSREILFWRSMPVSETSNLAAKLTIIYGVAPLIILVLALGGGLLNWLTISVVRWDWSLTSLTVLALPFKIYAFSMLMMLTLLPLIAWMLFASACAKNSPLVFSSVVPFGLMMADKMILSATGINLHIRQAIYSFFNVPAELQKILKYGLLPQSQFFSQFFIFTVIGVLLLMATIWLRNNRYEI